MEAFLKSTGKTNIQGLDLGSQIFTMIPSLNTLKINLNGNDVKLLTLLHTEIKNGKTVDEVVEKYKIKNKSLVSNLEKSLFST